MNMQISIRLHSIPRA